MNRADLQRLSTMRVREAKVLFKAREYSGAYYRRLLRRVCPQGSFAKFVQRYDFPDRSSSKVFTHRFADLIKLAQLDNALLEARKSSPAFEANWAILLDWNEESRYAAWTRDNAEAILHAIVGKRDGVLPWIKRHW